MLKLPDDILLSILEYIDYNSCRFNLLFVSKAFYRVSQPYIKKIYDKRNLIHIDWDKFDFYKDYPGIYYQEWRDVIPESWELEDAPDNYKRLTHTLYPVRFKPSIFENDKQKSKIEEGVKEYFREIGTVYDEVYKCITKQELSYRDLYFVVLDFEFEDDTIYPNRNINCSFNGMNVVLPKRFPICKIYPYAIVCLKCPCPKRMLVGRFIYNILSFFEPKNSPCQDGVWSNYMKKVFLANGELERTK